MAHESRRLTLRQLVVTILFGVWGGVFPIPVTTTAALLVAIWFASFIPGLQFNVPMTTLAAAINVAVIPIDLMLLPHFISGGCWTMRQTPEELGCDLGPRFMTDIQEKPLATLQVYLICFSLAVGLWAVLTPFIILLAAALSRAMARAPSAVEVSGEGRAKAKAKSKTLKRTDIEMHSHKD